MSSCAGAIVLQVWDLKDAGLQAASRVAAASDPLALLAEISQNFISLVSSLTRQKVGVLVTCPGMRVGLQCRPILHFTAVLLLDCLVQSSSAAHGLR